MRIVEALRMAREALVETTSLCQNYKAVEPEDYAFTEADTVIAIGIAARKSIDAALAEWDAQPAQEPPYVEGVKPIWETLAEIGASAPDEAWQHVNQRGPLTDTQIRRIQAEHPTENDPMPFARAIEAAHGIT
jgi:hypothetical protein